MTESVRAMIILDGATGEGGGQILRTALSVSALMQIPFKLRNIRAHRKTPGLKAQHLMAVQAMQQITNAEVSGAAIGSPELVFIPHTSCSGNYSWDIKTAGATSLVLQTVFLPLIFSDTSSNVTISGGTHVPWSPSYHYLDWQWLSFLKRMGIQLDLKLIRAGYYPPGGGVIQAQITPQHEIKPLTIETRGHLTELLGLSSISNLDLKIAERQAKQAGKRLTDNGYKIRTQIEQLPARSPGTMFLLLAKFENSQCCYFGLGARGKPAEKVADEAVNSFVEFMHTPGVVDEWLADQLVLPLAFAADESFFVTSKVTAHLLTNLEIIHRFGKINYEVKGEMGGTGSVLIEPRSR